MRTRLFVLFISVIAAVSFAGAAQSRPAEILLEAARKKAVIDGDLDAAVRDYQTLADRYRIADPPVAAAALLHLAEAHESVADGRSRSVYERLATEHADRSEGRTARARLAQSAGQAARVLQPIWEGQGADWSGKVSGDGRFLPFVETRDVMVRDLTTGTNIRLTHAAADGGEFAQGDPVISRDGSRVAYTWWLDGGNRSELRVIDRRNQTAAPRVVDIGPDVSYAKPLDWLSGAERLALQVQRRDRTAQIGLVTLADGSYRALKSVDWRGTTNLVVSPNGEYLAYDLPVSETSRDRDVFVLRWDGSRMEQRVNERPGRHAVVGWAPDGALVLFATERAGTMVLHGTAVSSGIPQGAPRVIEPDLGTFDGSRGVTDAGRLVFTKKIGGINVFTAEIDFATGAVVSSPERVTDSVVSNHPGAMWSPDGNYLAYVSIDRGGHSLMIRSVESGAVREITPPVGQIQFPRWTTPAFITFQGSDVRGRQGIFRTDVQTGETTLIAGGDGAGYRSWADATPDGRQIAYARNTAGKVTLLVQDLASAEERTLAPGPATATRVSPDGRMVAYRTGNTKEQSIMVVPISGGTTRAVLTVAEDLAHFVDWMPDGRHVLAKVGQRLVIVALDGGLQREIQLPVKSFGPFFKVHADGRRVAYSAGPATAAYELWTLDNFLPGPAHRTKESRAP